MSESLITFQGLTVVQVSRNQVAVISDPQNHVFVLKNSGFVAYGIDGSYDVLAIVDPTRLPHVVKDHVTGSILGRSLKIWKSSNRYAGIGPANSVINDYVVALLYVLAPSPVLFLKGRADDARDASCLVWIFRRTIARLCNVRIISSSFLPDNTVSSIQPSHYVDSTRLAKMNLKCRRGICAWITS